MQVCDFDFVEYHNENISYDDCTGCYGVVVYSNQVTYFAAFTTIHLFKHKLDCLEFAFKIFHKRPFELCKISNDNEVVLF